MKVKFGYRFVNIVFGSGYHGMCGNRLRFLGQVWGWNGGNGHGLNGYSG